MKNHSTLDVPTMANLFSQNKKVINYSSEDIIVLEGLEPVRKRPGMYIGGTDEKALHHLVIEVLDNAIDEAVAGYANLIEIEQISYNTIKISDNGRGIPVDPHPKYPNKSALEVIMTTLHSGGKFTDKNYKTSGGLHGVGVSVVNALSNELIVEVSRDRKLYSQTYSKGIAQNTLSSDFLKCYLHLEQANLLSIQLNCLQTLQNPKKVLM